LNIGNVSRSALARANEKLDPDFYQQLFHKLYQRCQQSGAIPGKKFRFKEPKGSDSDSSGSDSIGLISSVSFQAGSINLTIIQTNRV